MLVILFFTFIVEAAPSPKVGGQNNGREKGKITLFNIKIRPKDLTRIYGEVVAYIYDDHLSICFEIPEGMVKVSLAEYGDRYIYRGYASSSSDIIVNCSFVSTHVTPTRILVETSEDNAYEGWIDDTVFNDTFE